MQKMKSWIKRGTHTFRLTPTLGILTPGVIILLPPGIMPGTPCLSCIPPMPPMFCPTVLTIVLGPFIWLDMIVCWPTIPMFILGRIPGTMPA